MAANAGKEFEKQFKESVPENTYFLRLKDTFAGFGNTNRQSFTSNNPCDSILYSYPIMYLLEFKSSKGTSFSFSEKIIKKHQIEDLKKASNYKGVIPGFVFNFRKFNETWFVHINDFCKFKDETTKVSINRDDCKKIGLKINQTLKRTRFLYHINTFIKESKEKYIEE